MTIDLISLFWWDLEYVNCIVYWGVVRWFVGFYGIPTFGGYLIHFYANFQFDLKNQFSMSTQFNYQKHFYFWQFNLVKQF